MKISFFSVLWIALICSPANAAPSPCQSSPAQSQASFSVESGERSSFDDGPGISIDRRHFAIRPGYKTKPQAITVGYGHEYSIFDVDSHTDVRPLTNGHLHTLYLPVDLSAFTNDRWYLRLQPTLSVSSNLLKKPRKIEGDAWQPNVAIFGRFGESSSSYWELGFCGDHRFGDYRIYPGASWNWRHGRWSLRAGYPDSRIERLMGESLYSGLRLSPAGNRWFVHHKDGGNSFFKHEAWRAEWYLDWRFAPAWQANLNVGKLIASRHEFKLENGATFRDRTGSPLQVRLGLVWHY